MIPKQRVLDALHCRPTDRVPWVPFVGCHAGALLGISAEEYLKSADNIVRGAQAAIDRYEPDGIPVTFDLQIEAEAMGCELAWAAENPPAVTSHPLAAGTDLSQLKVPGPDVGRLAVVLQAARAICRNNEDIAIYGLVTGPFTLALHLLGTDIFMKMFDEPGYVGELLDFCMSVTTAVSDYHIEAGCDVIAVVDPMTSQIGPDQFRQFVSPHISPVFDHVRKQDIATSFFVCGHAQQNIEVMCQCGPDNVSVDENIPLDFVKDVCLPAGVSFGGNMQLTTVLLLGNEIDAQRSAVDCLEIAGDVGFVLSPGCDLPYAVPPENLQAVAKVVGDPYQRDIIKAMAKEQSQCPLLDMREYGQGDKVIVDIITLDSEACAPCQYMVEAVRKVAPEFEGIVEWREHKIKHNESLVFMTSLMVHNVPTICIDGQIKFVSRIPSHRELVRAIQDRIHEKLRKKIQRKPASLIVLGDGGPDCRQLEDRCEQAALELGAYVTVQIVTDEDTAISYGVSPAQTPAVVLASYRVVSTECIPEVAVIKEWIKLQ